MRATATGKDIARPNAASALPLPTERGREKLAHLGTLGHEKYKRQPPEAEKAHRRVRLTIGEKAATSIVTMFLPLKRLFGRGFMAYRKTNTLRSA